MAKRRLTRRQQWRIKKVQEEKVKRSESREANIKQAIGNDQIGPEQTGLVIAHYGSQVEVEALEGEQAGSSYRCHIRANIEAIVTGDLVIWSSVDENKGIIVANSERRSELVRPDMNGLLRPVAANIDQIFIVIAPEPPTALGLIDRYLVAAETVAIQPILLLNKTDLINSANQQKINEITELYQKIGYQIISTSAKTDANLTSLKEQLAHQASIFVGQSGVGKSSLINSLLPDANLRTSALSEASGKGTHTTTTACLYHLPDSGDIIDSPGIREFGLEHIDTQTLVEGFIEFRPFFGQCRFRNCSHLNEPNCALHQAVTDGKIDQRRFTSFQNIVATL